MILVCSAGQVTALHLDHAIGVGAQIDRSADVSPNGVSHARMVCGTDEDRMTGHPPEPRPHQPVPAAVGHVENPGHHLTVDVGHVNNM